MTTKELLSELKERQNLTYTRQYIQKLAKEGKIPFVELNGKKDYNYDDVILALQQIKQRNPKGEKFDPLDKDGKVKTINSTKIMLQEYQGKLAQQKFDIEAGKLVYREDVENKAFTVARVLRDQMLAIPERLAGELASTMDVNQVKEIMYTEINQVLGYIADESVLYD